MGRKKRERRRDEKKEERRKSFPNPLFPQPEKKEKHTKGKGGLV